MKLESNSCPSPSSIVDDMINIDSIIAGPIITVPQSIPLISLLEQGIPWQVSSSTAEEAASNGVSRKRPHDATASLVPNLSQEQKGAPSQAKRRTISFDEKVNTSISKPKPIINIVSEEIPEKKNSKDQSPSYFLMNLTLSMSIDIKFRKYSKSNYYNRPSSLQLASFGSTFFKVINANDVSTLKALLQCGLSPNPCNAFGDSVLNNICRRGNEEMFHALMDCGASIHVMDSFGRTPLHYLCWSNLTNSCWSCVKYILEKDPYMLITEDNKGKTPLDYIPNFKWNAWRTFISNNVKAPWFIKLTVCDPLDEIKSIEVDQTLPNPSSYAHIEVAKALSSGKISPMKYLEDVRTQ